MSLAWLIGWVFEHIGTVVWILGVTLGALGSLIVIYPDIKHRRGVGVIGLLVPKVEVIERARVKYREDGVISDQKQLDPILEFAETRYAPDARSMNALELMGGIDAVEQIERTDDRIVWRDGDGHSYLVGPSGAGASAIEAIILFDRAMQRYCRQRGMLFVAGGFFLLLVSRFL